MYTCQPSQTPPSSRLGSLPSVSAGRFVYLSPWSVELSDLMSHGPLAYLFWALSVRLSDLA